MVNDLYSLLRALRHPQRDSEFHTDLVPILLGLGQCVERGRKSVRTETDSGGTTTHTTTYGYLTDSQFEFAHERVRNLVQRHQSSKKGLLMLIAQVSRRMQKTVARLTSFREYLAYVDVHLPRKMDADDARGIIGFHTRDYSRGWERVITHGRTQVDGSAAFAKSLLHCTSNAVERISERTTALESTLTQLDEIRGAITADVTILRR